MTKVLKLDLSPGYVNVNSRDSYVSKKRKEIIGAFHLN